MIQVAFPASLLLQLSRHPPNEAQNWIMGNVANGLLSKDNTRYICHILTNEFFKLEKSNASPHNLCVIFTVIGMPCQKIFSSYIPVCQSGSGGCFFPTYQGNGESYQDSLHFKKKTHLAIYAAYNHIDKLQLWSVTAVISLMVLKYWYMFIWTNS